MRNRKASGAQVPVYSSQKYEDGEYRILRRVSVQDAAEEALRGRAVWLRGGTAIQLKENVLDRCEVPSPSGIPAAEMRAATEGSARAREKVRLWGLLQRQNFARLVVSA